MSTAISSLSYKTDADVVKTEGPNRFSRDEVTIVSGQAAMVPGTVLGKITASGKYKIFNNANADGSEVPAAILLETTAAAAADITGVVVLKRHAEVVRQALVWASGVDATEQAAALVVLETAGIVTRRGV